MIDPETKKENENRREENYFISLSKAAKISGYTPEHLNLLCRKGVLKARKFGRNWETTREWLNEFLFLSKSSPTKSYTRRRKKKKITTKNSAEAQSEQLKEKQDVSPLCYLEKENLNDVSKNLGEKRSGRFPVWFKVVLNFSLAVVIAFGIFVSVSFVQFIQTRKHLANKNIPEVSEDQFLIEQEGIVQGEETQKGDGAIAKSENFKMKEISFGGVLLASASSENLPIEIADMKSEVFVSKDGKKAEILVSWKTNKLAVSEISYAQNGSAKTKQLQEKSYGFNHMVILSNLELGTNYYYQVKVKDRWSNEKSSEKFVAYTGSKVASVFDLIVEAVDETFSWAIKK